MNGPRTGTFKIGKHFLSKLIITGKYMRNKGKSIENIARGKFVKDTRRIDIP